MQDPRWGICSTKGRGPLGTERSRRKRAGGICYNYRQTAEQESREGKMGSRASLSTFFAFDSFDTRDNDAPSEPPETDIPSSFFSLIFFVFFFFTTRRASQNAASNVQMKFLRTPDSRPLFYRSLSFSFFFTIISLYPCRGRMVENRRHPCCLVSPSSNNHRGRAAAPVEAMKSERPHLSRAI